MVPRPKYCKHKDRFGNDKEFDHGDVWETVTSGNIHSYCRCDYGISSCHASKFTTSKENKVSCRKAWKRLLQLKSANEQTILLAGV